MIPLLADTYYVTDNKTGTMIAVALMALAGAVMIGCLIWFIVKTVGGTAKLVSRHSGPPTRKVTVGRVATPAGSPPPQRPSPEPREGSVSLSDQLGEADRGALLRQGVTFRPRFVSVRFPPRGTEPSGADPLGFAWCTKPVGFVLDRDEEMVGWFAAKTRLEVRASSAASETPNWLTICKGSGIVAVTGRRVCGVVVRGDSLFGPLSTDAGRRVAWDLDHSSITRAISEPELVIGSEQGVVVLSKLQTIAGDTWSDMPTSAARQLLQSARTSNRRLGDRLSVAEPSAGDAV